MSIVSPELQAALRSVFDPLARLLLRSGIGVRPIISILKQSFVDAAISEHGVNGKPASISKASEITGLTRKEVRDIRDQLGHDSRKIDLEPEGESHILAFWHSNTNFLDERGNPRTLQFGPGAGTFVDLVDRSTGNKSYSRVLERLVARRCVKQHSDGRLSMLRRDWVITSDVPRLLEDLGYCANTVNKNWSITLDEGLCQRTAYSSRIDPKDLVVCRRNLRARITSFIEEIDDQLTSAEIQEGHPDYDSCHLENSKIGVSAFYFEIEKD